MGLFLGQGKSYTPVRGDRERWWFRKSTVLRGRRRSRCFSVRQLRVSEAFVFARSFLATTLLVWGDLPDGRKTIETHLLLSSQLSLHGKLLASSKTPNGQQLGQAVDFEFLVKV